jgi:hypothetical protein
MQDASPDKLGGLSHVLVLAGLISLRLGINNNNTGQEYIYSAQNRAVSMCTVHHATWGLTIIRTPQQIGLFIYRRPTLYPVEIAVDFLKSL